MVSKFRLSAGDVLHAAVYANIVGGVALRADDRMNWIEITRDHQLAPSR